MQTETSVSSAAHRCLNCRYNLWQMYSIAMLRCYFYDGEYVPGGVPVNASGEKYWKRWMAEREQLALRAYTKCEVWEPVASYSRRST